MLIRVRLNCRSAPNRSNTSTLANALGDVARVWTGLFTAKGRALTAAKRIAQRQANQSMLRAMLDPDVAKRMAELSQLKTGSKRAAIILGQVGATMLADPEMVDQLLGKARN